MHKFAASTVRIFALSGFTFAPSWVFAAANLDVNVGADLVYHSNAALANSDEKSDIDRVGRVRVGFDNPDPFLLTKLDYIVERHDYQDNVEPDRTVIIGAANLKWTALPRLLDFTLSHQVSDQVQDRRLADVNSNVERRSIVSAGSDLYAHLSKVDTIILNPSFSQVNLQSTNGLDSHSSTANVAWQHALSAVSSFKLNGAREFVRFDDSVNDYNATRAMLGINTQLSHLSYSAGAGFNRIARDVGKNTDGFSLQISADYNEAYYSWGGAVIRQLTDTTSGLSSFEQTVTNFHATDGNVNQFDIVEITQADFHGQRQLTESSRINGKIGYTRQNYQVTARDEDSYYASIVYNYTLNSMWGLGVSGAYGINNFLDDPNNLKQKDKQLEVFAQYQHSKHLSARFGVGRQQRDANVSTVEYMDNFVSASVNFLLY